jgi:hypothetical protein
MRSSSAWYTGGAYTTRSKLLEAFSCTEEDGLLPPLSNDTSLTDEHIPPPKPSTQLPSARRNTHTHTHNGEEGREQRERRETARKQRRKERQTRRGEKRRADGHRYPSDQGG